MARPQIEDGHTKIANELVEAFAKCNFTGHESRLLWVIFRKTYGWNKKTDRISYSQFSEATGIDRRHIGRALVTLKAKNVITITGAGYALEYGIQKDYESWKFDTISGNELTPSQATIIAKDLTPSQDNLTPSEAMNLTPFEAHTKDNKASTKASTKDISKKETFEDYLKNKVTEFPTLNVSQEWKDCQQWYEEKGKKITIPKSALNNWLKISLVKQTKIGGNSYGANQKISSRQLPSRYTTPEEYDAEQGVRNVPA